MKRTALTLTLRSASTVQEHTSQTTAIQTTRTAITAYCGTTNATEQETNASSQTHATPQATHAVPATSGSDTGCPNSSNVPTRPSRPNTSLDHNRTTLPPQQQDNHPSITVLQVNLNHSRIATLQSALFASQNRIDVLLLQDPFLIGDRLYGYPTAWKVSPSTNKSAWVVVTNNSVTTNAQPPTNTAAFVTITLDNSQITLASQYILPNADISEHLGEWSPRLNRPKQEFFLIGGDFNAHSPLWGYKKGNQRGIKLLNSVTQSSLEILNNPLSRPTYQQGSRCGWPDLTIATPSTKILTSNWNVREEDSFSDHRYITFSISVSPKLKPNRRYYTRHGKTGLFQQLIRHKTPHFKQLINNINSTPELDYTVDSIMDTIKSVCDRCFRKKTFGKSPTFRWWTPQLAAQRNKITALKRKLQKTEEAHKPALKQRINKEKAQFKKNVTTQKTNSWRTFCTDYSKKFGTTYKIAQGKTFTPSDVTADCDTQFLDNSTANTNLIRHLFPYSRDPLPALPEPSNTIDTFEAITQSEVRSALYVMNHNKAPGPDNLDLRIWRLFYTSNPSLLLQLIQICFKLTHFPKTLKLGEMVFFLKRGKDPNLQTSYRPICLLPALGKILEKIVHNRLSHYLESKNLLSPHQFGFREGRSCEQLLHELHSHLKSNRQQKNLTAVLNIDISGAFDNASWSKIIKQLINLNCPPYLIRIISSYLSDRAVLPSGGVGTPHLMSKGCPQGSVIGPLCWLLIAQDLLSEVSPLTSNSVSILSYADDFTIAVSAKTIQAIQALYSPITALIDSWLLRNNLTTSKDKSTLTIITKGNNITPETSPSLTIQNSQIPITHTFTCLGLTFSNTLSWSPHIKKLREKTYNLHKSWRIVSGRNWGTHSNLLKIWYKTSIETIITYASGIWGNSLTKKQSSTLLSIQRPFLITIARAYRTTPTSALNVLTGLPPLPLVIRKENKLALLLRLNTQTTINNTKFTSSEIMAKTTKLQLHPASISFPHVSVKQTHQPTNINIYTDGSRSEEGTGAAFVVLTNGHTEHVQQHRLKNENTIFQAEALAVWKAIIWARENNIENLTIHTDSQTTILATQSPFQRDPLIQCIQKLLIQSRQENKKYHISWVRAHQGTEGNELADTLAKAAAKNDHFPTTKIPLPITFIKNQLYQEIIQQWQTEWELSETGRHLFDFIPKVSTKRLIHTPWLTTLITNHGPFAYYLFRFNKATSPLCICGSTGTARHYMHQCSLTEAWRIQPPQDNNTTLWITRALSHNDTKHKLRSIYLWLVENEHLICDK